MELQNNTDWLLSKATNYDSVSTLTNVSSITAIIFPPVSHVHLSVVRLAAAVAKMLSPSMTEMRKDLASEE